MKQPSRAPPLNSPRSWHPWLSIYLIYLSLSIYIYIYIINIIIVSISMHIYIYIYNHSISNYIISYYSCASLAVKASGARSSMAAGARQGLE